MASKPTSTAIPHLMARGGWSTQSIVDPAFAKLGSLLRKPEALGKNGYAFFGVPFEGLLINDIGGKGGPDGLRAAFSKLRPYSVDLDIDFTETQGFCDLGDVEVDLLDYGPTFKKTETVMREVLKRGWTPVVAGGSHSISEATIRAFSEAHDKNIGIVWLDGHPDLMDDYKGDKHYCGCPMRRLIESGALRGDRFLQIGLRGYWPPPETLDWMAEQSMRSYEMTEIVHRGLTECLTEAFAIATDECEGVFLSVDIDVCDPGHAPGTGTPEPGGLSARQLLDAVRRICLELPVCGVDVVEVSPPYDHADITAALANRVVLEALSAIARRRQDARDGTRWDPALPLLSGRAAAIPQGHLGHSHDH